MILVPRKCGSAGAAGSFRVFALGFLLPLLHDVDLLFSHHPKLANLSVLLKVEPLLLAEDVYDEDDNAHGSTVVHFAARGGYVEVIRFVVEMAVNIDAVTEDGDTHRYIRSNTSIGMPWSTRANNTNSQANSGDTSSVVLGLHIEQLSMVPGNGIQGTYAEMRQAVTRV